MYGRWVWAMLAIALGAGYACVPSETFQCSSSASCTFAGDAGICQQNGFCSHPDGDCPSGQRYDPSSGGGLANTCVPDPDGGSTGLASTSATASGTSTATTAATTTGATTTIGATGDSTGIEQWFSPQWPMRHEITLDATDVVADHLDYPVAVVVDLDPANLGNGLPGGADLVFTDADGVTQLAHEIERFDAMTGALVAWVNLPRLDAGSTVSMFVYFGNPNASNQEDLAGTWPDRYAGVWHLTPQTSQVFPDASQGENDAIALSVASAPVDGLGTVGAAAEFDGVNDVLIVADPPDGRLDFGIDSFAFGGWVFLTGEIGEWDMVVNKGGSSPTTAGYDFEFGANAWLALMSDGLGNSAGATFGNSVDLMGRWVHVMAVVDRDQQQLTSYLDGQPLDTADISAVGSVDASLPVQFSRSDRQIVGRLDEMRVIRGVVTREDVADDWWLQRDPGSLATLGPLQMR